VNVNVTKYVPQKNVKNVKFVATRCVLSSSEYTTPVFGRGSAPDPAVGSYEYDAPSDPLFIHSFIHLLIRTRQQIIRPGRGTPIPFLLDALGVSISARLDCQPPAHSWLRLWHDAP